MPTLTEARKLMEEYISSDNLRAHCIAVSATMGHFAKLHNEDIEKWQVIGMVHDLDWEKFPEKHCYKTQEILQELGWPEDYIHAIMSHGWNICTDVEPKSQMEKTLYAIDELTGFIAAVTLVRPSKSVMDVKISSIKKKWKTTAFAGGVDRSVIERGAEILGVELDALIRDTLSAMQEVAEDIGLAGAANG